MSDGKVKFSYFDSPVGALLLVGSDDELTAISFPSGRGARQPGEDWVRDDAAFAGTKRQLDEYFSGERLEFDLPLVPRGNDFQMAVWRALRDIPYGGTVSYGDIARTIGQPVEASRAVGTACGENPLPVVIPCHRVIGADGSLTGFGGGIETKRALLGLERRVRPMPGAQLELL